MTNAIYNKDYNPHYDGYIDKTLDDEYQPMHDKIAEDGRKLRHDLKALLLEYGVDAIRFSTDMDGAVYDACLVMHGREIGMGGVSCAGVLVDEI